MRQCIRVFGLASNKEVKVITILKNDELELSLMEFLINNGITIASSCNGVGSCKKCLVNGGLLSCQITLLSFIQNNEVSVVEVSYL